MVLIPVGDYWTYAIDHYPSLQLYDKDGTHPSPKGSFLMALVLYKMLVDSTVNDIIYWPPFIKSHDKEHMLELIHTL